MWPGVGAPDDNFYFDTSPNMLGQFLANKNIAILDAAIKVDPTTVQISRHRP